MRNNVTICSVGDLMLSDSPLYVSVGVGSKYDSIKENLFSECVNMFESADVVIGNLESVVYDPQNKSLNERQMSSQKVVAEDLKKNGFSVLNMANNHCLQHGVKAFLSGIELFESKDIKSIGKSINFPKVLNVNGIRIVLLSLCIHLEWYEPQNIVYEYDIEKIIRQISDIHKADSSEVIILSVHWGDEFAHYPTNAQIQLAHKLVDCGADIILGHHSHIYQGIESYKGAIIAYSQGNFVSDMIPLLCRQTGVIRFDIQIQNESKIIDYEMIPYVIDDSYCPRTDEGEWFIGRQIALQKAISEPISDEIYWQDVRSNHSKCHQEFTAMFKRKFFQYDAIIRIQMIYDFVIRKLKRKIGKVGSIKHSMDSIMLSAIENTKDICV